MKLTIDSNILRSLFQNVYFINGTAYAGKSTMVRLLAEKYDGICCGENYHMELLHHADPAHQPNLCYFNTMSGWQEFISRTPQQYRDWIDGTSREAAQLEIIKLLQLVPQGKRIFVDSNIPIDVLKLISDYHHVAIMLSPQSMSVERFFDRSDPEKQFLLQQIQAAPDPVAAMENYRACLAKINSPEIYELFAQSGFFTYIRQADSSISDALSELETHFHLNLLQN